MEKSKQIQIDALQKKIKMFKIISIFYVSVLLMMLIVAILMTQQKGISVFTFFPLFFFPLLILCLFQIKKIKKQIINLKKENG